MSNLVSNVVDPQSPLIFLGVADGASTQSQASPMESLSLFQIARVKPHFVYPAILKQSVWCFLVNSELWNDATSVRVQLVNSDGVEQANINFSSTAPVLLDSSQGAGSKVQFETDEPSFRAMVFLDKGQWLLQTVAIPDLSIKEPGEYRLLLHMSDRIGFLGRIILAYVPPQPLTDERVSALEADPASPKSVVATYGCKKCEAKLMVYTALKKDPKLEAKGYRYNRELPDQYSCNCGTSNMSLRYLREGMHGYLGRDARVAVGEISYVQRYAHSKLVEIASKFLAVVQKEKSEEVIQKHLEQNKVLFARFHAKRFFIKPRILGKFNADFAILDSEGVLTLVEIERPTIRLFKKNGHVRNELNHAYEQVRDWLDEVGKHRAAVIEGLGLKVDEVLSIRGCVIAGRSSNENRDHMRRHMSQPPTNIEFLTIDMLGDSLIRIASDLP